MKIIKASYSVEPRDEQRGGLAVIERAARTCYKTEDAIRNGSAESIVKALIHKRHEAMLEHGDYIFLLDDYHILDNVVAGLVDLMSRTGRVPMLSFTNVGGDRPIVSGNVRAWRELFASGTGAAYYFTGAIDPIYTEDLIPDSERIDDPRIHQLRYVDLFGKVERQTHLRQTVRFIVDRGVTHEFVRHRVMSFAQESTRYVDYASDKHELTVIDPCYLESGSEPWWLWKRQCMSAETAYRHQRLMDLKPQEARGVLPTSLKAELVMTGTLWQWNHFFDMRARQNTGPAHPQAVEVALPLMQEMAACFPDVIDR